MQKGWYLKNSDKSINEFIIWPRVTCILAIDNYGKVYYSLLQCHANNDSMRLFLFRLVEILDKENKEWRTNTVF